MTRSPGRTGRGERKGLGLPGAGQGEAGSAHHAPGGPDGAGPGEAGHAHQAQGGPSGGPPEDSAGGPPGNPVDAGLGSAHHAPDGPAGGPPGGRSGSTDEARLGPRDFLLLGICLAVTVVSLAVGIYLYPRANPEASIRFEVSRDEAQASAERLAGELGISLDGARHASRFDYDSASKVFLERTLGLEETNRLVTGPVRMWRWAHRWFRPLEREELRVDVATTGEIVGFEHVVGEDDEGDRTSVDAARELAESFLGRLTGTSPDGLEFLDAITTERKARTDHAFVWRDPRVDLGEGDYRHEVRIVGGTVGAYRQFVHLPESWVRDYQGLRSRNQSASLIATVLTVLTILAAVVVFFRRIRLRDIRWRLAAAFGGTGAALVFLGQLNLYPMFLFEFDTTMSWGGFLLTALFQLGQSALAFGLLIFVLTASGDALYRERYPDKIPLSGLFTLRGMRTKRFLLQTVIGFALAAGFFLFQEVFYLVASGLGAWAPADVPYSQLLGTAVPLVFLLLVGFQPAVVEEFLSRMFSIPLLQKVTRTWIAVLIPALIWGFAHANYPNQPFYIRGLEVGFVGVIVGIVMLRTGILAPLVWHYLVDAIYSSVFLFRSGEPYYVASAALAAGVVVLPLAYAVVSYLRRGSFEDPRPLLSRSQPTPSEPDWIPLLDVVPPPPRPWPGRRRAATLGAAAVLLAGASLLPSATLDRKEARSLSPKEARDRADELAGRLLGTPDSFRVAIVGENLGSPTWLQYVAEEGGWNRAREAVAFYGADFRWKVRYFRPLDPNDLTVHIDGATGQTVALSRHLAEDDVLPALGSDAARVRALSFLVSRGVETSRLDLRGFSTENRPGRLDHTFLFEAREGDDRNVGEGRHRVEVEVQGDEVGSYRRYFHVPETWTRDREKSTFLSSARLLLLTITVGLLLGLVGWLVFDGHRRGVTRGSAAVRVAIVFGVIGILARLNEMPGAWFGYDTATPWNQFVLLSGALLALSAALLFGLQVIAGGVIGTLFPDVWHLRRHEHRRAAAWDAFAAALVGLALFLLLGKGIGWLGTLAPGAFPPGAGLGAGPPDLTAIQPWFQLVARVATRWLFLAALLASAVRLAQLGRVDGRVWALIGVVAVVTPTVSGGVAAWAMGLVPLVAGAGILAIFVRWVAGANRLAYGVSLWLCLAVLELGPYLGAAGLYFQLQAVIALAVLLLPLLWLALAPTVDDRVPLSP